MSGDFNLLDFMQKAVKLKKSCSFILKDGVVQFQTYNPELKEFEKCKITLEDLVLFLTYIKSAQIEVVF